jgi:alkylhydroperoxidase/carboxymuconolactone decarboxylase family protein YurZ
VYGGMYERLRANVRELHPSLDAWMIVEGYGKVLSRPGLDLARRELCIVSACAAAEQDRDVSVVRGLPRGPSHGKPSEDWCPCTEVPARARGPGVGEVRQGRLGQGPRCTVSRRIK